MIVARLLIVALVIAVVASGLTWMFTGDRNTSAGSGACCAAPAAGVLIALFYVVERVVLR